MSVELSGEREEPWGRNRVRREAMRIRATLLFMAESEIKAMIPPYYFADIKRRDPKPLFKAYVVGQEGQAEASWVGVGKVVKNWFKDAIGKLVRKIYAGLKLFHNHEETNEPDETRTEIGEVAGSRAKMIDGKFSAVIAAYIYPEYKDLPLDIASIEADIIVNNDVSDDIHAVDVDEVTGIALGNSAVNKPGFPGATLLGELQAFAGRSVSTDEPKWQLSYKRTGQGERRKFELTKEA